MIPTAQTLPGSNLSTPNLFMTREIFSQETDEHHREPENSRSVLHADLLKGRNLPLKVMFLKEHKVVDTLSFTISPPASGFEITMGRNICGET